MQQIKKQRGKKSFYQRLSFTDREEISRQLTRGASVRKIARQLKRDVSTISREVASGGGRQKYRPLLAQKRSQRKQQRQRRKKKLETNLKLRKYVIGKLFSFWSPEQIANAVKIDYPLDTSMRIAPETIYRYVYVQPKGELKKSLVLALRRAHKHRYKKNGFNKREVRNIPNMISIDERPKEAKNRKVPGHWEGDLIIGKQKASGLGTLVERTSRKLILAPLKEKDHVSVSKAFIKAFNKIPRRLRKTLTYDRGGEMSSHEQLTKNTKVKVYFAHSKSPWERGTNENTNGLVRQFFPKGTDFRKVSQREIKRVERLINQRPRKTLKWKTPDEVFEERVLH